jgi:predicted amidohydrolase
VAKYRKIHLFTVTPIEEHKCFSPGHELVTFSIAGLRFGLSICYDYLRFPEFYRILSTQDQVNAFLLSSAWHFLGLNICAF